MNANEVIIPCRLSYANIWEPKQVNGAGDPKYSCCLLISKKDTETLAKIKAAMEAVKKDPASLAAGCYFLNANANANRRPLIVDRQCAEILDQEEVYSGCYAQVKVGLFSYSASGNRGIGAGLETIRKVRDGERLSGGNNLDGFEALDDADDSFLD